MNSFLNQTKNRITEFFQLLSKYISQGEINQTSIIIAYYVLLSIFPIIIIIGNVLPLLNIDTEPIARYLELTKQLKDQIAITIPREIKPLECFFNKALIIGIIRLET